MLIPKQQAAVDAAGRGENVFMPATAGSGKTRTIRAIAQRISGGICVTFGRKNADEARAVLPKRVYASSFHALAYARLREHFDGRGLSLLINERKLRDLYAGPLQDDEPWPDGHDTAIASYLGALHEMRLNLGLDPSVEHLPRIMAATDDDLDPGAAHTYTRRRGRSLTDPALLAAILDWGGQATTQQARGGHVTYLELLTLPLQWDLVPRPYEWVLADEAQDMNAPQREWVRRLGRRYVIAGGVHQAIFEFTGSSAQGMLDLAAELGCHTYPLPVTFRCPTQHVALARRFDPSMRAADGAQAGTVEHIQERDLDQVLRSGDVVLARTNATLFTLAFRLHRAHAACPTRTARTCPGRLDARASDSGLQPAPCRHACPHGRRCRQWPARRREDPIHGRTWRGGP